MEAQGAVRLFPMSLNGASESLASAFRAGRSSQGFIIRNGDGLAVQLSGMRVPLPGGAGDFVRGQRVTVALVETESGPTLRVSSIPIAPSQSAPTPASPARLVSTVLETLGAFSPSNLAAATEILPAQVALPEGAMRAFFSLFVARREAGRSLVALNAIVGDALAQGVVPPEFAREIEAFAKSMKAADAESFRVALRSFRVRTGSPIETQLAELLLSGGELEETLFVRLSQMRYDAKLGAFLKESGQWPAFESAVDSLLEQFRGADLQHLRAPNLPYHFMELPLDPEGGIRRAQIHFFGEDADSSAENAEKSSIVMLDLSLSNLGDLWITLRTSGERCLCRIEATQPDIVTLIQEESDTLTSALSDVGYSSGASVDAGLWQGDRLEAVADAFRGLSGLNLTA